MNQFDRLRIDPKRFRADFDELASIGATSDQGVCRPALSEEHLAARSWFLKKAQASGLHTRIDAAGNHIVSLAGPQVPAKPKLLLGSHLDSVPQGGRFDGALGVVAGLEVLRVLKEAAQPFPLDVELYDFTDEEGRYIGLLGSQALAGLLQPAHLHHPGSDNRQFEADLRRAGLQKSDILNAKLDPGGLVGYLELHIEQGTHLEVQQMDIGIVTAIVGIRSFSLHFIGRADHAGTTPMDRRFDSGLGAAAFNLAAHQHIIHNHPGCVVTVGNMQFFPGAFNVIPKAVAVAVEFRADEEGKLDDMESELLSLAADQAQNFGLALEIESMERAAAVGMDPAIQKAINKAVSLLKLKSTPLASGAGHDAQSLAQICPAGMIFIPSAGGFSHSPREKSLRKDCLQGADVLLQTTLELATGGSRENTPPHLKD